jgi:hypothetical protein
MLGKKKQMITKIVQVIRWNRGVVQLLSMKKLEMPTPPCRRETKM